MELTLTGGTILSSASQAPSKDVKSIPCVQQLQLPQSNEASANMNQGNPVAVSVSSHHNHSHNALPTGMITASYLLPSNEQLQRFKTNTHFRLNTLSNVVRRHIRTFHRFVNCAFFGWRGQ